MKYWDAETRRKAAELFSQGNGYKSVARELGIAAQTVREWEYKWRSLGEAGLSETRTKRRYSPDIKVAVVHARLDEQLSISEIMKRYGIANRHQVKEWCKLYLEEGEAAFEPRRRRKQT